MVEHLKESLEPVRGKYENLWKNLIEAITLLLEKNNIKFVSVNYRVKSQESFKEKIERKWYSNPFKEMEDICWVRIVCYYKKDISHISKIILDNFEIHDTILKETLLSNNQFWYRSTHHIISIKKDWEKVPNYTWLSELKAEIQVRTILMHARAEIEHNLSYKKISQVPDQFKRKLSRISAKLEEADEQFEELKSESNLLQEEIRKKWDFSSIEVWNYDTMQAFLDSHFPNRTKNQDSTINLSEEFNKIKFNIDKFEEFYKKYNDNFFQIIIEIFKIPRDFGQVWITRVILCIIDKNYLQDKLSKDKFLRNNFTEAGKKYT